MDKTYYPLFSHRWLDSDDDEWNFPYGAEEKALENNFTEGENYEIDTSNYPQIDVTLYEPQTAEETGEECLSESVLSLRPAVCGGSLFTSDATMTEFLMWYVDHALSVLFDQLTHVPDPVSIPWWIFNVSQAMGGAVQSLRMVEQAMESGLWDKSAAVEAVATPFAVWVAQWNAVWREMLERLAAYTRLKLVPTSSFELDWWTEQGLGAFMFAIKNIEQAVVDA